MFHKLKVVGRGAAACVIFAAVAVTSGCAKQSGNESVYASPAEVEQFRKLETELWDAWSSRLRAEDARSFYSQRPGTLHFDIAPLKFVGWEEYEREAQKALPPEGGTAKVTINDDFIVMKSGPDLAVVAFTFDTTFYRPDGSERSRLIGRETDVWTREGDRWVILHQHMSVVPPKPASQPAPAQEQASAPAN